MKLLRNSDGLYQVQLDNGKILMDGDTMILVPSSHRSRPQIFTSKENAIAGYQKYLDHQMILNSMLKPYEAPVIKNDFVPVPEGEE